MTDIEGNFSDFLWVLYIKFPVIYINKEIIYIATISNMIYNTIKYIYSNNDAVKK